LRAAAAIGPTPPRDIDELLGTNNTSWMSFREKQMLFRYLVQEDMKYQEAIDKSVKHPVAAALFKLKSWGKKKLCEALIKHVQAPKNRELEVTQAWTRLPLVSKKALKDQLAVLSFRAAIVTLGLPTKDTDLLTGLGRKRMKAKLQEVFPKEVIAFLAAEPRKRLREEEDDITPREVTAEDSLWFESLIKEERKALEKKLDTMVLPDALDCVVTLSEQAREALKGMGRHVVCELFKKHMDVEIPEQRRRPPIPEYLTSKKDRPILPAVHNSPIPPQEVSKNQPPLDPTKKIKFGAEALLMLSDEQRRSVRATIAEHPLQKALKAVEPALDPHLYNCLLQEGRQGVRALLAAHYAVDMEEIKIWSKEASAVAQLEALKDDVKAELLAAMRWLPYTDALGAVSASLTESDRRALRVLMREFTWKTLAGATEELLDEDSLKEKCLHRVMDALDDSGRVTLIRLIGSLEFYSISASGALTLSDEERLALRASKPDHLAESLSAALKLPVLTCADHLILHFARLKRDVRRKWRQTFNELPFNEATTRLALEDDVAARVRGAGAVGVKFMLEQFDGVEGLAMFHEKKFQINEQRAKARSVSKYEGGANKQPRTAY